MSSATARISMKKQTLEDAYSPPANFLEIDVISPQTHGLGKNRHTDYEVRMKTNLPVFKLKDSSVRRRYSDFEWLRGELERDSKIVVPPLPGKAWTRQLPFRQDDGIFAPEFLEERRQGLESFINKYAYFLWHSLSRRKIPTYYNGLLSLPRMHPERYKGVAGHPLAQNERSLHMFLQEPVIDRNYHPGKIRSA